MQYNYKSPLLFGCAIAKCLRLKLEMSVDYSEISGVLRDEMFSVVSLVQTCRLTFGPTFSFADQHL